MRCAISLKKQITNIFIYQFIKFICNVKRKFLILSAALLTVCGAALLQSCSSEYEYYEPTSEYGYYTEEEIAAIKALGEMYGLSIDFNEDYNGIKYSLRDIEDEMIGLASLLGKYEMVHEKDINGHKKKAPPLLISQQA